MGIDQRLKKINEYQLFASDIDPNLSELLKAIAELMSMPIALVSIVDNEKQFFKGKTGLDAVGTPLDQAFCRHVVESDHPFVVPDAKADAEFKDNPLVTGDTGIQFYAGVPLQLEGVTVGSVCVLDRKPRKMSKQQLTILQHLSEHVSAYLKLLLGHKELEEEHSLFDDTPAVIIKWRYEGGLQLDYVSNNIESLFGLPRQALCSRHSVIEDYLGAEGIEQFNFMLSNHLNGVETSDVQFRLQPDVQRECWVRLLTKAFWSPDGTLQSIHGMLIDNTSTRYYERRLNEANSQMKLVLESSALGTWNYDVSSDRSQVNQRWCDIIGIDLQDFDPSYYFWRSQVHPADIRRVEAELRAHQLNETQLYNVEYRLQHSQGHWVWVEAYGRVVKRDEAGNSLQMVGTLRDITAKKEAELHEKRQRQLLSFINKAQAVYLNDQDLSKACRDILPDILDVTGSQFAFIAQVQSREQKQVLFIRASSQFTHNNNDSSMARAYWNNQLYFESLDNLLGKVVETEETVIVNHYHQQSETEQLPFQHPKISRFLGLPITLRGETVGMIGLANKFEPYTSADATFLSPLLASMAALYYAVELDEARMQAETTLKNLAMTDPMTSIPNRRAFSEFCSQLHNRIGGITVAILDIDHFKQVNDTFGHAVGDSVICELAHRLTDQARSDDFVARLGGEEFAVILFTDYPADAHHWLEQLRLSVAENPLTMEDKVIPYTISVGAHYIKQAPTVMMESALELADKALYRAKAGGRNQVLWSQE